MRKIPMNWIRVLLINVFIFFSLLVAVEMLARSVWTINSCINASCNFTKLSGIKLTNSVMSSEHIGLSRFDPDLGYVPAENFDAAIYAKGWNGVRVTINGEGYRVNGNNNEIASNNNNVRILSLGDSFTFGDQVSNNETWSACLENKLDTTVDNAGVFGYGAAQALKRGMKITEAKKYSVVILSVLVGSDFDRDQLVYRSGFPKPALILEDGKIQWSDVPNANEPGTKYNPSRNETFFYLYKHSFVASLLMDEYNFDSSGDNLDRRHPKAAEKGQIISWTLNEFSKLNIDRKILLLQYLEYLRDDGVNTERQLILEQAAKTKLKVIDTYSTFVDKEPSLYWKGHHTPLGNQVVCDLVSRHLQ